MSSIEINPKVMGGQPCIKGRRLTIDHLIGYMFSGTTIAEYCSDFEVEKELIKAVLKEIEENIGAYISEYERNVKNK